MNRKIVLTIMAFAVILQGTVGINATSIQKNEQTTLQNVVDNVVTQFESIRVQNKTWMEANLEFDKALFDSENQISAYLFSIEKNGDKLGYLIANTSLANNIIEYGEACFLDEAMEKVEQTYEVEKEEQKVYYLGDLNYVIGGEDDNKNDIYIDVSTSQYEELEEDELVEFEVQASTPPDSGNVYITNPEKYEQGYDYCTFSSVTGWNLTYYKMTDFSSGGVCAPTAATNLLYYWHTSRGTKYKKLLNSTWKKTFDKLCSNMGTKKTGGTTAANITSGLNEYLNSKGYGKVSTLHIGTNNGKKLIPAIDENRPCLLMLYDHYLYKNHVVLALGYQDYVYKHWNGNDEEIYIRIMDGWTDKANRFVWGKCSGSWNYLTVDL